MPDMSSQLGVNTFSHVLGQTLRTFYRTSKSNHCSWKFQIPTNLSGISFHSCLYNILANCIHVQAFNMFQGMGKKYFQIAQFKTFSHKNFYCIDVRKLANWGLHGSPNGWTPEKPIWLQQHHIGLIASWSLLGFLSALLLQQDLVLNLLHTRQSGFMDIGQVAPPAQPFSLESRIFWSFLILLNISWLFSTISWI